MHLFGLAPYRLDKYKSFRVLTGNIAATVTLFSPSLHVRNDPCLFNDCFVGNLQVILTFGAVKQVFSSRCFAEQIYCDEKVCEVLTSTV